MTESPPDHGADPVAQAWARVEAEWDDPDAHRRFLGLCASLGQLPEAARLLREARDRDPGRRERAQKSLDALVNVAVAAMAATRTEPPKRNKTSRFWLIGLGVSLALIAAAFWTMMR